MVMTCVSGHLTRLDFGSEFSDWNYPPPERLFDGPVHVTIDEVCPFNCGYFSPNYDGRIIKLCHRTLNAKQEELGRSLSGLIVIAKENILAVR